METASPINWDLKGSDLEDLTEKTENSGEIKRIPQASEVDSVPRLPQL
jgi:hypothetical protein